MKKFTYLLLLIPFTAFSDDVEFCDAPILLERIDQMVKHSELVDVAAASNDRVIEYFTTPTQTTCNTVTYKFPEMTMKPGDSVYFHVPPELRERGVRFMVLGHRQNPMTNEMGVWDDKPGLSSVQVYNGKSWNYWNGDASGKQGAKFAEVRFTPEMENLYDWDQYGFSNAKTDEHGEGDLLPEAFKITSVGQDEVLVSEITLKVSPPKEKSRHEQVFSPGTSFTSPDGSKKYTLGGGQEFGGKFPDAKVLTYGETYSMPLSAGKKIASIEVAAGDSHPDGIKNSDGGIGTQGWAKISVGIKKKDGSIKWFLRRENVPPQGMILASPSSCDEAGEEGSEVIVQGDDDNLYIMGIKIGYQD